MAGAVDAQTGDLLSNATLPVTGVASSMSIGGVEAGPRVAISGMSATGSAGSVGLFPIQHQGPRVWHNGAMIELCMVAESDAPAGVGGVLKIRKGGVNYAAYLVGTANVNASPVRIKTSTGVKSIRVKT